MVKLVAVLAALAGLALGWLLWGRTPPPGKIVRVIDSVLVQDTALAREADSLRREDRAKAIRVQQLTQGAQRERAGRLEALEQVRALSGVIDARFASGDTVGAIVGLRAQLDGLGMAYQACDREADSLQLAVTTCGERVTGLENAAAVDSTRIRSLRASLTDARDALKKRPRLPRWEAGALWSPGHGWVPVGGWVSRRVGPLVLLGQVADDGDGSGSGTQLRLGAGITF